jgi:hypothetical protein
MVQVKALLDEYGVLYTADKKLPTPNLKVSLVESLAELENNECHRTRQFPKTRLHRVKGVKQAIYRADIDKTSGWRLHLQYIGGRLHLKDIISGSDHDNVIKVIKSKKDRYN